MKTFLTICSGILIVYAVGSFAQHSTTRDQDKSNQGTVDADRDRAGHTGEAGRGAVGKGYGRSDLFGALTHRNWDLDSDGRISKNEYQEVFKRLDADGDGCLSPQEFRQVGSLATKPNRSSNSSRSVQSDRHKTSDTIGTP
jgi:hypothetical protein